MPFSLAEWFKTSTDTPHTQNSASKKTETAATRAYTLGLNNTATSGQLGHRFSVEVRTARASTPSSTAVAAISYPPFIPPHSTAAIAQDSTPGTDIYNKTNPSTSNGGKRLRYDDYLNKKERLEDPTVIGSERKRLAWEVVQFKYFDPVLAGFDVDISGPNEGNDTIACGDAMGPSVGSTATGGIIASRDEESVCGPVSIVGNDNGYGNRCGCGKVSLLEDEEGEWDAAVIVLNGDEIRNQTSGNPPQQQIIIVEQEGQKLHPGSAEEEMRHSPFEKEYTRQRLQKQKKPFGWGGMRIGPHCYSVTSSTSRTENYTTASSSSLSSATRIPRATKPVTKEEFQKCKSPKQLRRYGRSTNTAPILRQKCSLTSSEDSSVGDESPTQKCRDRALFELEGDSTYPNSPPPHKNQGFPGDITEVGSPETQGQSPSVVVSSPMNGKDAAEEISLQIKITEKVSLRKPILWKLFRAKADKGKGKEKDTNCSHQSTPKKSKFKEFLDASDAGDNSFVEAKRSYVAAREQKAHRLRLSAIRDKFLKTSNEYIAEVKRAQRSSQYVPLVSKPSLGSIPHDDSSDESFVIL